MTCELWDTDTGNLLGVYDTRDEAEQVLAANPGDTSLLIIEAEDDE